MLVPRRILLLMDGWLLAHATLADAKVIYFGEIGLFGRGKVRIYLVFGMVGGVWRDIWWIMRVIWRERK